MKKIIVQVRDKTKVLKIKEYSKVIYVSKFMNTIGIEIRDEDLYKLDEDENVISHHESQEGTFQINSVI